MRVQVVEHGWPVKMPCGHSYDQTDGQCSFKCNQGVENTNCGLGNMQMGMGTINHVSKNILEFL